ATRACSPRAIVCKAAKAAVGEESKSCGSRTAASGLSFSRSARASLILEPTTHRQPLVPSKTRILSRTNQSAPIARTLGGVRVTLAGIEWATTTFRDYQWYPRGLMPRLEEH